MRTAPGSRSLQITLAVIACLAGLLLASLVWRYTWDDSAITLGYARHLALSGELRFGRFGERVEGFTTLLWAVLMAAVFKIAPDPARGLGAAKVLCAGLYLINALLVDRLARAFDLSGRGRTFVVILFALSAVSIVSVADAMENHLFLGLHLAAALLWLRLRGGTGSVDRWLLGLVLACLLLCRPEGTFLCAAFVVGFPFEAPRTRPGPFVVNVLGALCVAAVAFGALLFWRHHAFGTFVTNSVLAKRWPPYSVSGRERLTGGLVGIGHFLTVVALPLAPFAIAAANEPAARTRFFRELRAVATKNVAFVVCIACYAVFFFVTGPVWGTKNRVVLAVIPMAWCLLAAAYEHASIELSPRLSRAAAVATTVLFVGIQGFYFFRYVTNEVTVVGVRDKTEPAAALALLSSPPGRHWRIAIPDVGGPLLWWGEDIEWIDTALLNERTTARDGWGALPSVLFDHDPPDAILTHTLWTTLGGLDRSEYLRAHYAKVRINGDVVFLRNDRLDATLISPPPDVRVDMSPAPSNIRDDSVIAGPCVAYLTVPTTARAGAYAVPAMPQTATAAAAALMNSAASSHNAP